jgi:hypothetical protein
MIGCVHILLARIVKNNIVKVEYVVLRLQLSDTKTNLQMKGCRSVVCTVPLFL